MVWRIREVVSESFEIVNSLTLIPPCSWRHCRGDPLNQSDGLHQRTSETLRSMCIERCQCDRFLICARGTLFLTNGDKSMGAPFCLASLAKAQVVPSTGSVVLREDFSSAFVDLLAVKKCCVSEQLASDGGRLIQMQNSVSS